MLTQDGPGPGDSAHGVPCAPGAAPHGDPRALPLASQGSMLTPHDGPAIDMASRPGCGLGPGPVHRVLQPAAGGEVQLHGAFEVAAATSFNLALFPDLQHDSTSNESPPPNFDGARFGVWAELDDDSGTRVALADQHGHLLDGRPRTARGSCLVGDNWNLLCLALEPLCGRRVRRVVLSSEPGQQGAAWLQVFGVQPLVDEPDDVVERVDTRRGSHSAYLYSRGNTLPYVCVPHGFNFLTPLTNARQMGWPYTWHHDHGPTPRLEGLAISHAPSPWIGDRSAFQLMPWTGGGCTPAERSKGFWHADEQAHPHHYGVRLDDGTEAEMTATSHAAMFRFRMPPGPERGVVLDQPFEGGHLRVTTTADGRASFQAVVPPQFGWSRDLANPRPPMYVYGEFSVPGRAQEVRERRSPLAPLSVGGRRVANSWLGRHLLLPMRRPQAALVTVDADVVTVRLATSFISVDQARHNLDLEVGGASFDDIRRRTHDVWAELLQRLEVEGGRPDQRATAWGALSRLYYWPNEHHENVGTAEQPRWAHASPYRPAQKHSRTHTGCQVVPGRLHVNNGYWDTARTAWPAHHLLTPDRAVDLLDGILQQYREGGWMGRWIAPIYIDCMVGTSSDQVFADAVERGVGHGGGLDEATAYDSALRNATVPSAAAHTGRKSIARARFVGWVDTDEPEGMSWSLENAQCDAAIARWSASLVRRIDEGAVTDPALRARREEFAANAQWFAHRALSHTNLFDTRVGFYQGRRPDGGWRVADAAQFDPTVWGHDYTETNAWGQAFQAQHDGASLARLLGGEQELVRRLDQLLETPATTRPAMWGSYTYNTQEMNEAQAAGLGQLAISNQPAHHIPYMYLFGGRPDRTQWLTRELLDTQFVGGEIGQGHPGDEDNGEMSAWWLLTAMGLYPLFPGGPEMVLTAPLFPRMRWTRDDGTVLEVRASGVEHRYVQSVRVNGQEWSSVAIPSRMLQGSVLVEVELGPEPTSWGASSRPWSASVEGVAALPGHPGVWWADRTRDAVVEGPGSLVDDRGDRVVTLAAGQALQATWSHPVDLRLVTLTGPDLDAVPVRVLVRRDGRWVPTGVVPRPARWADQTQAYALDAGSGEGRGVDGVRFEATAAARLSQVEAW